MSNVRSFAAAMVVWGLLGAHARADAIISNGDGTIWTFWVQGSVVSPSNSSSSSNTSTQSPPPPSPSVNSSNNSPSSSNSSSSNSAPSASSSSGSSSGGSSSSSSSSGYADAYLNFGNGPYPEASQLTTGGAQPWYTSPVVEKFFGGQQPNAQQQSDFANAVLKDVQATYQLSGLDPKLTLDPNVHANHTLSVVSNTSYPSNPNAIGITDVGANGFGFIDKLQYAQNLTDLEWAVAHNVSHELMHAFGVAVHHDQTGQYLDAATANWSLLINPNATFSSAAADDIRSRGFAPTSSGSFGAQGIDGDLEIMASPVPEPTTVALWGIAVAAAVVYRRRIVRHAA